MGAVFIGDAVRAACAVHRIDRFKEFIKFVAELCVFLFEILAVNQISGIDSPEVLGKQFVEPRFTRVIVGSAHGFGALSARSSQLEQVASRPHDALAIQLQDVIKSILRVEFI